MFLLLLVYQFYHNLQDQLHNSCQRTLSALKNSLQKYNSSNIPPHIRDKVSSHSERFSQLCIRAEERRGQIEDTLSSWSQFKEHLESLSAWCKGAWSEATTLNSVQNFAKDFPSLELRLQVCGLCDYYICLSTFACTVVF